MVRADKLLILKKLYNRAVRCCTNSAYSAEGPQILTTQQLESHHWCHQAAKHCHQAAHLSKSCKYLLIAILQFYIYMFASKILIL